MNKIIPSVIEDNGEYYIHIEEYKTLKQLVEHYEHLYSEVKKQKDNGIDWIKNNYCYVGKKMTLKPFSDLKDLLRMLGEIDVED